MSHDLRTPLASIKASATSLLQDDVDWTPEARQVFLATIDEEADRLNVLVGNLLDMSRLESGVLEVALRPVALEEVVAPAAGQHQPADRAGRGAGVRAAAAGGRRPRPARAGGGQRGVQRPALLDPPTRRVRIEAGEVGDHVHLRIIDQGPGVRPADRERIFEPFQRLGDRATAAGSRVWAWPWPAASPTPWTASCSIEDTPGGGLTTVISLRTAPDARADGGTAWPSSRVVEPMTRVLVVDDEPQIRRALATNLRAREYEVDLAATGEEALRLAAERHPDVVVLDIGLPGIDGIEVVRGLRGWSSVPIIILSVREDEHDKVEALDAGADDYLAKPFGMNELLARLRAAVRRATPLEELPVIETDDFRVDLAAKKVVRDGAEVHLTPTEWGLVEQLVRNRGKLVTQRQLLQEVWGPEYETEANYLRVYLAALRRKLEPEPSRPRYFITEPGMGYRFETDGVS